MLNLLRIENGEAVLEHLTVLDERGWTVEAQTPGTSRCTPRHVFERLDPVRFRATIDADEIVH